MTRRGRGLRPTKWRYTVGKFAPSILEPGAEAYYVGRERRWVPRGPGSGVEWHRLATAQTRRLAHQIAKMLRRAHA